MRQRVVIICFLLMANVAGAVENMPSTQVVANNIAYDHVVWNGIPIGFVVPVGQERILKFPAAVELHNTNPNLTTDKVSILNNDGFLYITAKKPFKAIRLPLVIKQTGKVVLIVLSAKPNTSDTPVAVVLPSATSEASTVKQPAAEQSVNCVTLMRYAIQHLYSPERLVMQNSAITRTPMYTTKSVNLFNNNNVVAMPLISWRAGQLYVTAVLLKNIWQQAQVLDPRDLKGSWLAASFYPSNKVTTTGTQHDRTTLFLISNQPFNRALNQIKEYS